MRFALTLGIGLALSTAALAEGAVCKSDPRVKWGCTKREGFFLLSASRGFALHIPFAPETYSPQSFPDNLDEAVGIYNYVVGTFELCPFAPEIYWPNGIAGLVWYFPACIESAENLIVLTPDGKPGKEDLCKVIDCRQYGIEPPIRRSGKKK